MPSDLIQLHPLLNRLRLTGVLEILDETITQAVNEKWGYSQLLLHLFSNEIDQRDHHQSCRRLSRSNLDPNKTLELFQFDFNKTIPQQIVKELCQCHFIDRHDNIFLVGPAGVGKTHLANSIGVEACRRGYDVIFQRTSHLLDWLHSGHGDGTFDKKMKKIMKTPLLILDDFGLMQLSNNSQLYLYEIISERYEKASLIITSNRDFSEWIDVFDNPLLGSAAMDRLVHKAIKVSIEGDSFRTRQFKNNQKQIFKLDNNKINS